MNRYHENRIQKLLTAGARTVPDVQLPQLTTVSPMYKYRFRTDGTATSTDARQDFQATAVSFASIFPEAIRDDPEQHEALEVLGRTSCQGTVSTCVLARAEAPSRYVAG